MFLTLLSIVSASCPVANPNPAPMTDSFKAQWEQTKDHLDDLTHDNRGAQVFRQYVETCEVDGNTATSSNELDMQIAQDIGGPPCFITTSPPASTWISTA